MTRTIFYHDGCSVQSATISELRLVLHTRSSTTAACHGIRAEFIDAADPAAILVRPLPWQLLAPAMLQCVSAGRSRLCGTSRICHCESASGDVQVIYLRMLCPILDAFHVIKFELVRPAFSRFGAIRLRLQRSRYSSRQQRGASPPLRYAPQATREPSNHT